MTVSVNLSRARRWRAVTVLALFGGGGMLLVFLCLLNLDDLGVGQLIGRLTIGVLLLAIGLLALRDALRPTAWVQVAPDGFRFHGHADEFQLSWPELRGLTLERERRSWGRSRYWSVRLTIVPKIGEFAMDHPEMDARLAGTRYVYELGRIGRSATRLEQAFTAACPDLFTKTETR